MTPQLDNNPLLLQGFAPLIQLWAGICLLFFYESLLTVSPFSKLRDSVRNLYKNFLNQYNGLLPTDAIDANEYVKDLWSGNFVPTIKCVASICFFYSAFILAYIGIEPTTLSYVGALPIMNTLVIAYVILAMLLYKKPIFHGFTTSVIFAAFILLYFHFHQSINGFFVNHNVVLGEQLSISNTTIYTLFTCIIGIIVVCGRMALSWAILRLQRRSVSKIYQLFFIFAEYTLGIRGIDQLPKSIREQVMTNCSKKFTNGEIPNIDTEIYLKTLKEYISKRYYEFTKKWWIGLY